MYHHTVPNTTQYNRKYYTKDDAWHVIHALKASYEIIIDRTGFFYGLNRDWNYGEGYIYISMQGYVVKHYTIATSTFNKIPVFTASLGVKIIRKINTSCYSTWHIWISTNIWHKENSENCLVRFYTMLELLTTPSI